MSRDIHGTQNVSPRMVEVVKLSLIFGRIMHIIFCG